MKPILVIIILLINTFLSFAIFLIPEINIKRKWCLCVSCILLPVFGIVGISMVYLLKTVFGQQRIDEDSLSVKLPGLDYISDVNFEKEVNVVPVEEALLINPNSTKRQMVMAAIKHNPADYLMSLKKALQTDDSETAHYAASGITDVKRLLERQVMQAAEQYEKQQDNRIIINQYIETLKNIIDSKLMVNFMQRQYQLSLVSVIKTLIENGAVVEEEKYELLIDTLMNLSFYEEASTWAKEFVHVYPKNERPLIYLLNLAYTLKDKYLFDDTFNELKNADFETSTHTRDIITYWEQDDAK